MARKQGNAADVWSALAPLITDLVPTLLDRWADAQERPGLKELQRDQVRMERRIATLVNHIRRLLFVAALLALWNAVLTALWFLRN
ncbi:MAG: hypothetical protein K1X75_04575 [Leptospirales bacterium]|nr:hypothetical protein [Leptospirales bacterium]